MEWKDEYDQATPEQQARARRALSTFGILLLATPYAFGIFGLALLRMWGVTDAWPTWLEPPFSGIDDAIVDSEGTLWVYGGYFHRISRYDRDGTFLGTIEGSSDRKRKKYGDDTRSLAASADGRVFLLYDRSICTIWPEPAEGARRTCKLRDLTHDDPKGVWIFESEPTWHALSTFDEDPRQVETRRVAEVGDPLLRTWGRPFQGAAGTADIWLGNFVQISTPDGSSSWKTGPWYLLPVQLLWPGLPFIGAFVWWALRRLQPGGAGEDEEGEEDDET